ncbi:MAG: ribosomal protein S18-alanine N-acetyltransferase [Vagococcus sp.]
MLNESRECLFHVESAKVTDIYLLQETLKRVYGKSPWSYTIFWSELIRKNTSLYLKGFFGTTYVGFIGMRHTENEAHITNVAVLPKFQGQGFGYLLLKEAKQFGLEKKCDVVSLEVKKSNQKAIELYRQFGFVTIGVKEKYYKENQEDAIEMTYQLEG